MNEIWIDEIWVIPIVVITIVATTGITMCLFVFISSHNYKKKKDYKEFWKDTDRNISVLSKCANCEYRNVCTRKEQFDEYKDIIELFEKSLRTNYEMSDDFVSGVVCKHYRKDLLAELNNNKKGW